MKTKRITSTIVFGLFLMTTPLLAQSSKVIYDNPEHTSGSLTLSAVDCTSQWWEYSWVITVPVNTPIKVTTQLNYATPLSVYTYSSGISQYAFSGEEPSTTTAGIITTNGDIYVYCENWLSISPTSDVFTITFQVDSTIYSQTNDLHVPGQLSVASHLNVLGNADIAGDVMVNRRLGIGTSPYNSKLQIHNYNQDERTISLFSSKSSTSSLYGLYSSAYNGIGNVYGVYSSVSGVSGKKWAGYFTGGDVVVMNGNTGIGVNDPKGILQVRGIYDNSWIYFSPNAGMSTTTKYKPRVNHGLAFTWNYSGSNGESIINYSRESGSAPRLDFTSFDGTNLTTEMTLRNGSLGIGITQIPDSFKLAVAGRIIAEEVVVKLQSAWPDYVFHQDYRLKPLHEVEQFVKTNKHLPGIPSAVEVEDKGLSMGEMQNKLLQKVEELTLYIIEQQKQIDQQNEKIRLLENR
jgi:hypothetical protein